MNPVMWSALVGLAVILGITFLLWLLSLSLRDASIADPFWAPGFFVVAGTYAVAYGASGTRALVVLSLVAAWAGRLGMHLFTRNRQEGEDRRYQAMRAAQGPRFPLLSLLTVFWLQAVLLWIISMPLLGAFAGTRPFGLWDWVGVVLIATGIVFEAVADAQLHGFKEDPLNAGSVMDRGLWRYSRHPNYFGNSVMWWGFYAMAVGAGAAWTAFSPLLMTFLLLRVSGVTMLERDIEERRPGYGDYIARTSAFVPRRPQKN
jgi:steroid 5-alpha reductase family enzyme